jgi:CHAD domain-containing protein
MSGRHSSKPLPVPEAMERSFLPSVQALHTLQRAEAPDPVAVHRARTSVRRLRSNVRVLNGHVEVMPSLRAELGWIGECLGTVRDVDVLAARVSKAVDDVPEALRVGGAAVLAVLAEERGTADEHLRAAVSSSRFGDLVDELDLLVKEASSSTGSLGARDVLRPPWRAMREAVRDLDDPPSDEQLHDLRIEAKRARYAAELFSSVAGARGARFVRRATVVQDALGAQHDAVRACAWFLVHGGEDTGLARACGWFAAQAASERDASRTAWRPAWKRLRDPKARFW